MTTEKLLIVAITALAGVIVYLFKLLWGQNHEQRGAAEQMIKEREGWNQERAKLGHDAALERQRLAAEYELKECELRGDYEKRHREIIERYDGIARADSRRMLEHEDQVRKEFRELMERMETARGEANEALVMALEKFYSRLVAPRT